MIRCAVFALILCGAMGPTAGKAQSETTLTEQETRLSAIGYRLAEANAAFCPRRERIAGASPEQPPICASKFWVDGRRKRDAGADGEHVRVTSGLIDYLPADDELAAVAAHELAHNQLAHPQVMEGLKKGRMIAIRNHEIEADRLAIWFLANAGYDPRATIRLWTRLGPGKSKSPNLKERLAILNSEIAALEKTPAPNGKRMPPLLASKTVTPHLHKN